MGYGRRVLDVTNLKPHRGQGANRGFPARAGSLYSHLDRPHSVVTRGAAGAQCRLLSCKRCSFARPPEAKRT